MRLIDADALLEFAKNRYYKTIIPSDIVAFPTVDAVEVVHGWWEYGEPERNGSRKPACSVCGKYSLYMWSDHKRMNYCPNCGAKMDGDMTHALPRKLEDT